MPKVAQSFGVLCDTGFLIRLGQPDDPLHANARGYLKYLLTEKHPMFVSTVALAEYAVRDRIENLPMRYFRVLPFNIDHPQTAGEFAGIVFTGRAQLPVEITQRAIIPNDTKMFAQAEVNPAITHYLTADEQCEGVYELLAKTNPLSFRILSLKTPHHQAFGELDLES